MKKLIAITAVAATLSSPAMAWGEREQGILIGTIGTIILQDITRNRSNTPAVQPVIVQQSPGYIIEQGYQVNSVERCGYQENVYRQGNRVTVEKRNACTGELIERRESLRRY